MVAQSLPSVRHTAALNAGQPRTAAAALAAAGACALEKDFPLVPESALPAATTVFGRRWPKLFDRLLAACGYTTAALFGALAACRWFGVNRWPIELSYHFIPYLAVAALALTIACGVRRRRVAAALCALIAAHFGYVTLDPLDPPCQPVPRFAGGTAAAAAGEGIGVSLMTYNVHFGLKPSTWTRTWIEAKPADILALQEVSRPLAGALRQPSSSYPHRVVVDDDGVGIAGVALLSSFPILQYRVFRAAADAWPTILARIDFGGGRTGWIVVLHARNPITPFGNSLRATLFEALADQIAGLTDPVVVVGDFNATPYTPAFRSFVRNAGLTGACWFQGSFPSMARGLGLPIDHVLVREARITELRAGRWLGSDHRAVGATLVLR